MKMEEKNNKTNVLSDSIIGFLSTTVLENLGVLEFLTERVEEPTRSFLFFILTFLIIVILTSQGRKLIFKKFPKINEFFFKHRKKFHVALVAFCCLALAGATASKAIKISDKTIPVINSVKSENNIIATEQYETPLVYHIAFEDETELKEVDLTVESVDIGDVTAEIDINKVSEKEYVLSLSNIVGSSGPHYISLKAGIAKDGAGNETESIDLDTYYLYNEESEIDREAPQINITQLESKKNNEVILNIDITDNSGIGSTIFNKENLVTVGFTADIEIERAVENYRIKLTNIQKNDENCLVVVTSGVATDYWNNISEHTVYKFSETDF